jgi:hypothetical protein
MRVTRVTTSAAAELTANHRRRERRFLRWFAVLIVTLLAAVAALDVSNRSNQRAIDLVRDLQITPAMSGRAASGHGSPTPR